MKCDILTVFLGVFFLMLLTGCSGDTKPVGPAGTESNSQQQGLIRRALSAEPQSLDPHKMDSYWGQYIMQDLFEGLLISSPDGSLKPGVAESWSNPSDTKYIFNLRKDAKWSNGDPVTAHDFVYAWRRAATPITASECAGAFSFLGLENATAIAEGESKPDTLGIIAVDTHTLEVRLEKPKAYFIKLMPRGCFFPLHQASISEHGEQWVQPDKFVTNGAFALSHRTVNERVRLRSNDHYWDGKNSRVNNVEFIRISDKRMQLKRYLAGDIDISDGAPTEHLSMLKEDYRGQLIFHKKPRVLGLAVNINSPYLSDVRVRRALSGAINRKVIAENVYGEGNQPAETLLPPYIRESQAHTAERDFEKGNLVSHESLPDAAFAGINEPDSLKVAFMSSDTNRRLFAAIAAMFKERLGIEVVPEGLEAKAFHQTVFAGDFDLAVLAYEPPFNDPFPLYLQVSNYLKEIGYTNPELESLILQSESEPGGEIRDALFEKVERMFADDLPFIPIVHRVFPRLTKPYIGGFEVGPFGESYSKDLWIKTAQKVETE